VIGPVKLLKRQQQQNVLQHLLNARQYVTRSRSVACKDEPRQCSYCSKTKVVETVE